MKIRITVVSYVTLFALAAFPPVTLRGQGPVHEITFEDVFYHGVFDESDLHELRSMNDGKHFTLLSGGRILKFSYASGRFVEVLFSVDQLERPVGGSIADYELAADDSRILLAVDRERIYRHSYFADYYVYDLVKKKITYLSGNGRQQGAEFSPDGRRVAYVRGNNLYYFDLEAGLEHQLTFDGRHGEIINGTPDWVYEEEFAFADGFKWSPDSRKIAFYRFDESGVRRYIIPTYGNLYPEWYEFKYPKAGEANSIVTIHVADLESGNTVKMDTGKETDQYIPRIKWTCRPDELCMLRENRLQNTLEVLLADAESGESRMIMEETNPKYIREPHDNTVVFLDDGEHFIYQSEKSGFHHFYLYDMHGNEVGPVTSGEWDIIEFLGYDPDRRRLFYSSYEGSSVESNVWSIRLDGTGKIMISAKRGWNTAHFSPTFDHYIHTHSDVTTPKYITLHNSRGKLIRVLEDNEEVKSAARKFGLPRKELFTLTNAAGVELNAYMYKPKGFSEDGEYPLLMYVYGGPESQKVRNEWETKIWHYLLLEEGYVIVCVDNRGTDGKGEAFRKSTYMQLCKLELEDQVDAARQLGAYSWIDADRIGIWGGSYGGHMSSLCITKASDVFRMAIALYPVTNWKYYDTIYTERFMRTPRENPDGYYENSPVHFADRLKGGFMLVHGMKDDNVHFQNSVDFAEALIQAGKQFEMLFYPNQIHGIKKSSNLHLHQNMTRFVEENL
jgi:dipeptidyl-peptidase-4